MRRLLCSLSALGLVLGSVSLAEAEEPRELSVNPWVSTPLVVVGATGWIGSELAKGSIVATQCRLCDRQLNGFDAGARDALRWGSSDVGTANAISNGLGFVGMPLLLAGGLAASSARDGAWRKIPEDLLVVVETTVLAADLNQAVKFAVQRERPFAHALPPSQKGTSSAPADENLSFYSGHTTLAFSLATSTAMVATLRGYTLAPVLWAVGLPLAAFTGYLRIAADKHYLSDVLVGALMGSAFGVAIPWIHRAQVGERIRLAPMGLGLSVTVTM
jgi:membrane-associated phospholipid phosphatase